MSPVKKTTPKRASKTRSGGKSATGRAAPKKKSPAKKAAKKTARKTAKKTAKKAAKKTAGKAAKKTAGKAAKKAGAKKTARKVSPRPQKQVEAPKASPPAPEVPRGESAAMRPVTERGDTGGQATSPLGVKYECFRCSAKFYDLNRPEPICPKCGTDQRDRPKPVRKDSAPAPKKRRRVRRMPLLDDDEATASLEDQLELELGRAKDVVGAGEELFDDAATTVEVDDEEEA